MRKRPRPGVYVLRDRRTGRVVRVGRTKDLNRRRLEHKRDAALNTFDFDVQFETNSYAIQRGLEQLLHEEYRPPLDVIAPIGLKNPRRKKYLAAARRFLQA